MGWNEFLQLIQSGEAVTAGNANRAPRTLDENVRYVYELLQAANIGETVFSRQQTVLSTALVGQPVYYRASTQQWEPGLAAASTDGDTGALVASESAHIWGIIYEKHNSTLADILLFGVVDNFDLTNALAGAAVEAGQYYLSAVTAGTITKQNPAVTVPVLKTDGNGKVFVNPQWEQLGSHIHFKFELQCVPAGEHADPGVGNRHTITSPDTAVEGWLPAGNAIFNGNAPTGAKFGYNISANPSLQNAFPPLPVDNAAIDWDKGEDADQGYHGIPIGEQGLVQIDKNGIWWMSDCYGDVPWPAALDTASSESISEGFNECPRDLTMRMILWFAKLNFNTDMTSVTSLTTDDARIAITCLSDPDKPSTLGDLLIRLNLSLTAAGDDTEGFLAFKEFDENTGIFSRGPVAEGMYTDDSSVTLSGSTTTTRSVGGNDKTVHHGLVAVSLDSSVNRDLQAGLVRLLGVTEEYYQDVMYLEFPEGEDTEVRFVFRVPSTLELASPKAKLRVRMFGRAAGTLPDLTVTARRITEPGSLGDGGATALPTVDSAVTISTGGTIASPNEYYDIESNLLNVAPGDDYLFTISRTDGSVDDGYSAALGLLRQALLIVPGS